MNPLRTRLAAAALGAGLVIAVPAAAWAGPLRSTTSTSSTATAAPSGSTRLTIDDLRTKCLAAIDVRLPALASARSDVAANPFLTDADRSALTTDIDATTTRLQSLQGEIRADTDLASLRDHCRSIFADNRVFALVLPRTRLVVGADTATAAGAKLTGIAQKLAAAVDKARAAGRDVTQAQADLDAMKAQIASGSAAAGTVPGSVLGLTPADWNANHDVLTPARQQLRVARTDLKAARDLAVKIRTELRTPAPSTSPQA